MGKKATLYLIHNLMILISVVLLLMALGGWRAAYVDPADCSLFPFLGLALPVVLILNLLLLLYWTIRLKAWLLVPLVALVVNVGYITAMYRLPFGRGEAASADLTVGTYNVHGFSLGEYRRVMGQVAGLFSEEGADVVCLQEFRLVNRYTMDSVARVFDYLPYQVFKGTDIALLSKYPVLASGLVPFPNTGNSAVWADLSVDGSRVRVLGVHMQTTGVAPVRTALSRERSDGDLSGGKQAVIRLRDNLRDNARIRAQQALKLRRLIDTTTIPLIVCGDFNDTPASFTYRTLKGDLTDGFKACGSGYGTTFRGFRDMLRIDYIFYSDDFEGVRYDVSKVALSDHRPVILHANLRPAGR